MRISLRSTLRKSASYCWTCVRILSGTLALLLWWNSNVAAQSPPPPVATALQSFGFDYKDADLSAGGVVRFEQQIDSGAFASIAIPPKANDAQTQPGNSTYKTPVPALTTGPHTVSWRACNATMCGDPLVFAFVLAIKPATVSNGRILGS